MHRTAGPNWLLRMLIVFSITIHAVIFFHISGVYRSSSMTSIEMSLQNIDRPTARDIPRPRMRPKPPDPKNPPKKINVVPKPVTRIKPLAMAPMKSDLPDSLMENISAPDIPQAPGVEDSSDWVPGPLSNEAFAEFMTPASYLEMVRLRIESRKRYPKSAKSKNIEGRVTVRFILAPNGSVRDVTVIKAANNDALNTAALEAVKRSAPFPQPPANLFHGDLSLKLTVVFELT